MIDADTVREGQALAHQYAGEAAILGKLHAGDQPGTLLPLRFNDDGQVQGREFFTIDQFAAAMQCGRRTIFRWVAERRIPDPQRFGKLIRWAAADVEKVLREGIPRMRSDDLRKVPNAGVAGECPHCRAKIVARKTGFELVEAPPPPPEPASAPHLKKKPAAKPPAKKGAAAKPAKKGKQPTAHEQGSE